MQFGTVGQPISRVDGRLKVTGTARYAAENPLDNLVHACLIESTISKGRVKAFDLSRAQAAPGVLAIITHLNSPRLNLPDPKDPAGGKPGEAFVPLQDNVIHYNGQHLGIVVADTFERARHAADLVRVTYEVEKPAVEIEQNMGHAYKPPTFMGFEPLQTRRGDPDAALAMSPVKVEQTYVTPVEHHNPLEPHACTAVWDGDKVTLYEPTQAVIADRAICAQVLGISPDNVQVISPFVGGGFGCKGSCWWYTILAAVASRKVGRPVQLVLAREQMFTSNGYRPRTIQKVALGAMRDGKLTAIHHASLSQTSVVDEFCEPCGLTTRMLYACPAVEVSHTLVRLNRSTPTFMRAPGESPGMFALESAMDELAYALNIDPVELRVRNHADTNPQVSKPWSSKNLLQCYMLGMEKFGWNKRDPRPRSMTSADGWLVGYGMATATYPGYRQGASARAQMFADGHAVVSSATQDIGTGTYTVMTQVAADALGLPLEQVRFTLGDSSLPPAPVSGGSMSVASVSPAVQAAAKSLIDRLISLALADSSSPLYGASPSDIMAQDGKLMVRATPTRAVSFADVVKQTGMPSIEVVVNAKTAPPPAASAPDAGGGSKKGHSANAADNTGGGKGGSGKGSQADGRTKVAPGGAMPGAIAADIPAGSNADQSQYAFQSFGAQFVEVRVNPESGEIRVVRVVNVFDIGRVLNPKTARSQILGGVTMGIGMAMQEHTVADAHTGRIMNADLGEYHVPVHADIPHFDVTFLDIPDPHINPLGVRGVGEIGITGVAAAIANAIYHATGKRIRDLPITPDKLL
jgi:xanthine dehydrogenase YagR molybdenum-binding subunit